MREIKSRSQTMDMPIPDLGSGFRWRRDEAIHFQIFVDINNSQGQPEKEKSGSGTLFLADLEDRKPVQVNLVLQSYLSESGSNPLSKGNLTIKGQLNPQAIFLKPDPHDLVPGNMDHLQSWMVMQVRQDEVAFSAPALKKLGLRFEPTFEETRLVHAPFFQTSVGLLPGWAYFASLGTDTDSKIDQDFYLRVLRIAAERNDRTLEQVTRAIERQEASTGSQIDRDYMDAVEIVANSFALMSNSLV